MSRVLGIDFGRKKTGLAISDPARMIASNLSVLKTQDKEFHRKIISIISEWNIKTVVLGLPCDKSGNPAMLDKEIRELGSHINKKTGVEIFFFDEQFSSKEADDLIAKYKGKKKKIMMEKQDSLAASFILQAFLDFRLKDDQFFPDFPENGL